jgi:hypothetical protein
MKDLNKQIDDVLFFIIGIDAPASEKSELLMQFSKKVKARHRFSFKEQTKIKTAPAANQKSKKRFYMNWFEAIKAR